MKFYSEALKGGFSGDGIYRIGCIGGCKHVTLQLMV